jgi:hypothetical protein
MTNVHLVASAALTLTGAAHAQSVNVDMGEPAGVPSAGETIAFATFGFPAGTLNGFQLVSLQCLGDLDDDHVVGVADLLVLLAAWGTPAADIDGDGVTAVGDVLTLLASWGDCE